MLTDLKQGERVTNPILALVGRLVSARIAVLLNRRERLVIQSGVVILALAFYFISIIWPLLQENTVLRSRLQTHVESSPVQEREMAQDVEKRLEDTRRRQQELLERVPVAVDRVAFLEDLMKAASSSGANVHGVRWEGTNDNLPEAGIRVQIRVIGSFEAHRAFVHKWASSEKVNWLESAVFKPSSEADANGWNQIVGTYRIRLAALPLTKKQPGRKHMGNGASKVR